MKKILYILIALALLQSCNSKSKHKAIVWEADKDFEKFKNEFVSDLWKTYPEWATSIGNHQYDSALSIPGKNRLQKESNFAQRTEIGLKQFNFNTLSPNNKTDYKLIAGFAEGVQFNIYELKSYEWDPSAYNLGEVIFNIIDYQKIPIEDKLRTLSRKLSKARAYFEGAKKNIHKPTKEHTQLAIEQNKGSLYFFTKVFPDSLKVSHLSDAEKADFNRNADIAQQAIEDYIGWLQRESAHPDSAFGSFRSFRIGKELYAKKFKLDIDSRYTANEMYKKAEDRKAFLFSDMNRLTEQLWSKYFPGQKAPADTLAKIKMMIDRIFSLQHCKRDEFMQTIEKQLPELTAFINAHHIIDLDPTKPLKVRKTPDYSAGVAGAGINSPGPYDTSAVTYYNVTPLTNYSDADAESYLREYNDYTLQILNIHEAIPGHYTQFIYANRSPDIIKTILGNGAMIEGWACYAERMMLEEGYSASPEMQLSYDKWNLREVCNFILDYNIQCNNWSEQQVMDLLVRQAFQQNAEAKEKWKRATLSQVQLCSYFTGLTEIYELREELKNQLGADFNLKNFNEQFLSYGSAPVKEIRELMVVE